jgi:hypothetical protein
MVDGRRIPLKAAPAEMKRSVTALRASLRLADCLQCDSEQNGGTDTSQPLHWITQYIPMPSQVILPLSGPYQETYFGPYPSGAVHNTSLALVTLLLRQQ